MRTSGRRRLISCNVRDIFVPFEIRFYLRNYTPDAFRNDNFIYGALSIISDVVSTYSFIYFYCAYDLNNFHSCVDKIV